MTAIYAAAAGNNNATTTWTGGVVPGPGDDVHLNGFLVTQVAPWSVANIYDDGNVGSAAYCNTANAGLTVSGTVSSTVQATQSNGSYGINNPTLILLGGSANVGPTIGAITSSGGSCGVAWNNANSPSVTTIGTITASGVSGANHSVGFAAANNKNLVVNLGSGSATGGAHVIDCNPAQVNANNLIVNCTGGITTSGYNSANVNDNSYAVYRSGTLNGNIAATGSGGGVWGGPIVVNGNVTGTNAKVVYQNNPAFIRINGSLSASGNPVSGNAIYAQILLMQSLSLTNSANFALDWAATLYSDEYTNDGTGTFSTNLTDFIWIHPGAAYSVAGASEVLLPTPSQVKSGVYYSLSNLRGTLGAGQPGQWNPGFQR